ncbi:hypothetical protein KO495_13680 [Colwellia sp. D2M02]|uniref:Uncharacterized protein n=1 Tax=Colwellia asteriadis TaxID=517723 RepID=A0ABN1LCL7_9GAMM|nr:hypothetical protein [Colwellia sp. D2M02]MBU2894360.1 hypothetical protein [Colwellia sp. D2M02]
MNDVQPSVVTSVNSHLNRIVSRSGHELCIDDLGTEPKVILKTLAGEHYIEFNAHKKQSIFRGIRLLDIF